MVIPKFAIFNYAYDKDYVVVRGYDGRNVSEIIEAIHRRGVYQKYPEAECKVFHNDASCDTVIVDLARVEFGKSRRREKD